jgi:hypothetical protein
MKVRLKIPGGAMLLPEDSPTQRTQHESDQQEEDSEVNRLTGIVGDTEYWRMVASSRS